MTEIWELRIQELRLKEPLSPGVRQLHGPILQFHLPRGVLLGTGQQSLGVCSGQQTAQPAGALSRNFGECRAVPVSGRQSQPPTHCHQIDPVDRWPLGIITHRVADYANSGGKICRRKQGRTVLSI